MIIPTSCRRLELTCKGSRATIAGENFGPSRFRGAHNSQHCLSGRRFRGIPHRLVPRIHCLRETLTYSYNLTHEPDSSAGSAVDSRREEAHSVDLLRGDVTSAWSDPTHTGQAALARPPPLMRTASPSVPIATTGSGTSASRLRNARGEGAGQSATRRWRAQGALQT